MPMISDKPLIIQIPTTIWFSIGDKESFFHWLYSIEGYISCQGEGRTLFVSFAMGMISRSSMQELVAMFRRYGIKEIAQLRRLVEAPEGVWFSDPKQYWHEEVFSNLPKNQKT